METKIIVLIQDKLKSSILLKNIPYKYIYDKLTRFHVIEISDKIVADLGDIFYDFEYDLSKDILSQYPKADVLFVNKDRERENSILVYENIPMDLVLKATLEDSSIISDANYFSDSFFKEIIYNKNINTLNGFHYKESMNALYSVKNSLNSKLKEIKSCNDRSRQEFALAA